VQRHVRDDPSVRRDPAEALSRLVGEGGDEFDVEIGDRIEVNATRGLFGGVRSQSGMAAGPPYGT
jgi:hypothetical protein